MNTLLQQEVEKTIDHLRQGHVILYPTDTVWGLGCDATLPHAVEAIMDIKGRTQDKGMLVLLDHSHRLHQYVIGLEERAIHFIDTYPRALTLIFPQGQGVAPQLLPPNGSIAIRIAQHAFCQAVIAGLGHPLVSTSANFSGQPTAQQYADISVRLKAHVDYVVDWERDKHIDTQPSTLIQWQPQGDPIVLRP